MEWDHFERLKPKVSLCSSHKDIVWLQKTWNATRVVCNTFMQFFWSGFAINTCDTQDFDSQTCQALQLLLQKNVYPAGANPEARNTEV